MLPLVTGEFRVATEPDLRFTPAGMAVGTVRAVASKRKEVDGQWVDDKTCWVKIIGFRKLGENMAESFRVGDLITVSGVLQTEDWEDKDGNKRTSVEIVANYCGVGVNMDPARSQKAERTGGSGGSKSDSSDDPFATSQDAGDPPPF